MLDGPPCPESFSLDVLSAGSVTGIVPHEAKAVIFSHKWRFRFGFPQIIFVKLEREGHNVLKAAARVLIFGYCI